LHRAFDKEGNTVDFLLIKRSQRISTQRFLIKAIDNNIKLENISIKKSGANTAVIKLYNRRNYSTIKIRQCKSLNNIVEQIHGMIQKNQLSPPKNSRFKSFISLASLK